jgi:hypothetical protein
MKQLIGITAFFFAFSSLAQADGLDDMRNQHPDARNDRQPAAHAQKHHVKHHRKAVLQDRKVEK